MDNVISGCKSESEAAQYYNEARSILSQAKFNLRSWASNSKHVQLLAQNHSVAEKDDKTKRFLGYCGMHPLIHSLLLPESLLDMTQPPNVKYYKVHQPYLIHWN